MNSGIYGIRNVKNGKWYIGSGINLKRRKGNHFSKLKCNYNENPLLQADYFKYGKDSFEFYILEYALEDILNDREYFWIDYHKSNQKEHGYNMRISKRCNHPCKVRLPIFAK